MKQNGVRNIEFETEYKKEYFQSNNYSIEQ